MEQKITGREIALFIAKFRLWDAYLDTVNGDCIDLRAPGDECSYTLLLNGLYDIEAWVDDHWERVASGDIYEEDCPKPSQM